MANLRWLRPGLGLKRWILLVCCGLCLAIGGAVIFGLQFFGALETSASFLVIPYYTISICAIVGGSLLMFVGVYRLVRHIEKILKRRGDHRSLLDIALYHSESGAKIVCIGGGTGMNRLLSGLREYSSRLTAVVSVADDGGSSGRLRSEFGMLPPGDIRNCLSALADASDSLGNLLQYRFTEGELAGHAFGNLLIMVLMKIHGSFETAVREANRILNVRGQVLPVALEQVTLVAMHPDGTKTTGQKNIAQCGKPIVDLALKPDPGNPPADVLARLREADAIVIGPGSLYTSILPNLLLPEIVEAINRTAAKVFYVVNTTAQPGETPNFTVKDYLTTLARHAPGLRLTAAIVNNMRPSPEKLAQLTANNKCFTEHTGEKTSVRLLFRDVINLNDPEKHDSGKLAKVLCEEIAR